MKYSHIVIVFHWCFQLCCLSDPSTFSFILHMSSPNSSPHWSFKIFPKILRAFLTKCYSCWYSRGQGWNLLQRSTIMTGDLCDFPLTLHVNARIVTFEPSTTVKMEVKVFSKILGTNPPDWQQLIIDIDPVPRLYCVAVGDVPNILEVHDLNPEDGGSTYLWNIRNIHTV